LLLRSAEVYPVFSWFIARLCLYHLLLLYVPVSCFSVASHTGVYGCLFFFYIISFIWRKGSRAGHEVYCSCLFQKSEKLASWNDALTNISPCEPFVVVFVLFLKWVGWSFLRLNVRARVSCLMFLERLFFVCLLVLLKSYWKVAICNG